MSTRAQVIRPQEPGYVFRAAPHNYDAERALLGAVLMNNRAFERVSQFLAPDHFADPVNGRIYQSCAKLIEQGAQANPLTLKTYLERDELLVAAGGMKYLAALAASAVTIINAGEYGRLVYDLFLRRELIALGEDMVNEAFDAQAHEGALEIAEGMTTRLDGITAVPTEVRDVTMPAAVDAAIDEWLAHHRGDALGISTGYRAINDIVGYMAPGDLIFVAGNTSMGKTSLARGIAYHTAEAFRVASEAAQTPPQRVAFFTLEMSVTQLTSTFLTARTAIPGPRQRRYDLTETQWAELMATGAELKQLPLLMRYAPGLSLARLRSACRQLRRKKGGVGLVIVDYLQIMGVADEDRRQNRVEQVSGLTRGLKTLAGEIDCPMIVLSQLSRDNWRRENPRPVLPDLRDSGTIEQDADAIWFCYREEYFLERTRPERKESETTDKYLSRVAMHDARLEACRGIAEVIIAKNRHGAPGTAALRFDAPRAWFEDITSQGESLPPGRLAAQPTIGLELS